MSGARVAILISNCYPRTQLHLAGRSEVDRRVRRRGSRTVPPRRLGRLLAIRLVGIEQTLRRVVVETGLLDDLLEAFLIHEHHGYSSGLGMNFFKLPLILA